MIAWLAKRKLHRFPFLRAFDEDPDYRSLWTIALSDSQLFWKLRAISRRWIRSHEQSVERDIQLRSSADYHRLGSGNERAVTWRNCGAWLLHQMSRCVTTLNSPSKPRLVVKTVHALLALDWLVGNFSVEVLFVVRNPFAIYASYKRMNMPDGSRSIQVQRIMADALARENIDIVRIQSLIDDPRAFQIGLMYYFFSQQIDRHPTWNIVSHDQLCMAPLERFRELFQQFGLVWSSKTEQQLDSRAKDGGGFNPTRVSVLQPKKWRDELTEQEVSAIQRSIDAFNLSPLLRRFSCFPE